MGCKRYNGCIICVLFQTSWQLQTQIVKIRIISDSLLGNKLYMVITGRQQVKIINIGEGCSLVHKNTRHDKG